MGEPGTRSSGLTAAPVPPPSAPTDLQGACALLARCWLPAEPRPPSYQHLQWSTPTLMFNLLNTKRVRYVQLQLEAKKALDGWRPRQSVRLSTVKTVPSPFWIFYHENKSQRQSRVSCTDQGRRAPQGSQPPDSEALGHGLTIPGSPPPGGGDRCP